MSIASKLLESLLSITEIDDKGIHNTDTEKIQDIIKSHSSRGFKSHPNRADTMCRGGHDGQVDIINQVIHHYHNGNYLGCHDITKDTFPQACSYIDKLEKSPAK